MGMMTIWGYLSAYWDRYGATWYMVLYDMVLWCNSVKSEFKKNHYFASSKISRYGSSDLPTEKRTEKKWINERQNKMKWEKNEIGPNLYFWFLKSVSRMRAGKRRRRKKKGKRKSRKLTSDNQLNLFTSKVKTWFNGNRACLQVQDHTVSTILILLF